MGYLSHDCLTLHRSLSYQQKFSSLEIRGPVEEPHKERRYSCVCVCAQLCLTLCNSMDCSLQAPLSMEIPKQEYWSGLPFPPSGDLPDPGIKPTSPTLVGQFFLPLHQLGSPQSYNSVQFSHSVMSDSLQPHELQHARLPCPLPTPRASPNTCLLC